MMIKLILQMDLDDKTKTFAPVFVPKVDTMDVKDLCILITVIQNQQPTSSALAPFRSLKAKIEHRWGGKEKKEEKL